MILHLSPWFSELLNFLYKLFVAAHNSLVKINFSAYIPLSFTLDSLHNITIKLREERWNQVNPQFTIHVCVYTVSALNKYSRGKKWESTISFIFISKHRHHDDDNLVKYQNDIATCYSMAYSYICIHTMKTVKKKRKEKKEKKQSRHFHRSNIFLFYFDGFCVLLNATLR